MFIAVTHDGICILRCDRILWKSTIEPDPDSDCDESEVTHLKAKTRVGQFFANFKMRYRKGSYSSSTSSEVSNYVHTPPVPSRDEVSTPPYSIPSSPLSTPVGGKDLMPFSRFATPESSATAIAKSSSVDNITAANIKQPSGVDLLRSFSVDQTQSEGKNRSRNRGSFYTGATHTKSGPPSATPLPTTTIPKDDQPVRNGPPRWRFLPFFRGESSQTTVSDDPSLIPGESTEMADSSTTYRPRKGDVVCLGYDSLDDGSMRRLEGRSDHRPVIGSFAIYL